jgi:hypothetical protein
MVKHGCVYGVPSNAVNDGCPLDQSRVPVRIHPLVWFQAKFSHSNLASFSPYNEVPGQPWSLVIAPFLTRYHLVGVFRSLLVTFNGH